MKRIVPILIICLLASLSVNAQEYLVPLNGNPVLRQMKQDGLLKMPKTKGNSYLTLPFIEDFSSEKGVYPSTAKWSDRYAFVNNSYAKNPPTLGVATLDVIDDTGAVYANASFSSFRADEMTSQFIRLDSVFSGGVRALGVKDSIYMSFWYQPQGLGNAPDPIDILELQFLEAWHIDTIIDTITPPYDTTFVDLWNTVWSAEGQTLESFLAEKGDYFSQVLLPIQDSIYFRKDFRFRFVCYGSLADNSLPSWQSNVDHWNIDYVYLNEKRSKNDIYRKDISIVSQASSLLKTYDILPYSQYSANPARHMGDSMEVLISNLDTSTVISHFDYKILDDQGTLIHQYDGGDFNLPSYYTDGYQQYQQHAHPPVGFAYPSGSGDSLSFTTIQALSKVGAAGNIIKSNDTSRYIQKFRKFYALDDGTAEAGYGLTPSGSKLAYRFILDNPDTITAIQIFFNHTLKGANQQLFFLSIWDHSIYQPGDIIWRKEGARPGFESGLNSFYTYAIESDNPIVVQDTFYIGWVQTSDDNLNVGFDRHRNSSKETFFSVNNGRWMNSAFEGSLMMRPVFGKHQPPGKENSGDKKGILSLYPNPVVNHTLNLSLKESQEEIAQDGRIEIYDISGRLVLDSGWQESITLPSTLHSGMYFLRLRSKSLSSAVTVRFVLP